LRGEPVVMNIIRYGEPLVDFGGFFTPLKVLLQKGKIRKDGNRGDSEVCRFVR